MSAESAACIPRCEDSNSFFITVVFIGGFLNAESYAPLFGEKGVPKNMNIILVHPSGVASAHDRAMQIFYELKGGIVHFGTEHAAFHGHSETGEEFIGKFPQWDRAHPIHIVGHSFGGITARVLHAYLAEGNKFHGHVTDSSWVISVNTISAPLNGSTLVYSFGESIVMPPVVRWGSGGFWLGFLVHLIGYFGLTNIHDFKLDFWNLHWTQKGSFNRLLLALRGICMHSTTDNAAYDMSILSQKRWSKYLSAIPGTFYSSTVSTSFDKSSNILYWFYYFIFYLSNKMPSIIDGVDISTWRSNGFDGFVSVRSQEYPFLAGSECMCLDSVPDVPLSGVWYVRYVDADHIGILSKSWGEIFNNIQIFNQQRGKFASSAMENNKSRRRFARVNNIETPDMQVSLWTVDDRRSIEPSLNFSFIIAGIGIALLSIATKSFQVDHLGPTFYFSFFLSLSIFLSVRNSGILTSETIETVCSSCRLSLMVSFYQAQKPSCFLLVLICFFVDGVLCSTMIRFESNSPLLKVACGFALVIHPNIFLFSALGCVEVLNILSKLGWCINISNLEDHVSWKWRSISVTVVGLLCFLVLNIIRLWKFQFSPDAFIVSFILASTTFARLGDISEAFQVESLLSHRSVLQRRTEKLEWMYSR